MAECVEEEPTSDIYKQIGHILNLYKYKISALHLLKIGHIGARNLTKQKLINVSPKHWQPYKVPAKRYIDIYRKQFIANTKIQQQFITCIHLKNSTAIVTNMSMDN